MKKIPLICVVGPTASGKTSLSIDIAENYGCEIVSADSMQVYKGIHIASAAPDIDEMRGIRHHLIEFLEPGVNFTVADYVDLADDVIADIYSRGKIPLLVGGTGLYIDSLIQHIHFAPCDENSEIRQRLNSEMEQYGAKEMLHRLEKIDPETAQRLHPNNCRRIIRALEVFEQTGKTFSQLLVESKCEESPYDYIVIGINFDDRQKLYERIEKRIDIMLENGLEDEARISFDKGENGGSGQAIGHKELYPYFKNEISLEHAVENLKTATRRYAKRQLTWFKRNTDINWIYADKTDNVFIDAKCIIDEWRKKNED
ncbi:MAG: tRNA (adenosine(37)-N6)-dimethylallyltransferase MiaA [Ruminococcaceae bacterium]|nr:tRNA (adenosine(37)-N6)-dimethylallyltransferase MiaA [Oscillospiraceae bacterium]